MVKACIYCKTGLSEESVIDFCQNCGVGVWGEKMFAAIVSNMENARDAGDLHQGSVTQFNKPDNTQAPSPPREEHVTPTTPQAQPNTPFGSLVSDAMESKEEMAQDSQEAEVGQTRTQF
tara:strand:- start:1944 stop:2300 length:357 start_codon:yes stop_codon:yes gene_type:complete